VADADQLLNVALTRARAALHVVGDHSACVDSGGFLGDFAATVNSRFGARTTGGARDHRVNERGRSGSGPLESCAR
jgi:hypothetical protein